MVDSAPGDRCESGNDPALTVELLADLQAGLLDDDTAARVRKRIRADPAAARAVAGLNRVRRDVAALNSQTAPAPEVPPDIVARVAAALRSAEPPHRRRALDGLPAHAVRPGGGSARLVAAVAGLGAAIVAAGLGTAALLAAPAHTPSGPTTARHVTVTPATASIALTDRQILDLLDREPDYGPLTDPQRRASCLTGLGYPPNVRVLGAQPVQVAGRAGVLLVLPDDTPGTVAVLAVAPSCSSADTGLLASRVVRRR